MKTNAFENPFQCKVVLFNIIIVLCKGNKFRSNIHEVQRFASTILINILIDRGHMYLFLSFDEVSIHIARFRWVFINNFHSRENLLR